jgi:hypothetical protein
LLRDIPESSQPGDLDFDDIARYEQARWITEEPNSGLACRSR